MPGYGILTDLNDLKDIPIDCYGPWNRELCDLLVCIFPVGR